MYLLELLFHVQEYGIMRCCGNVIFRRFCFRTNMFPAFGLHLACLWQFLFYKLSAHLNPWHINKYICCVVIRNDRQGCAIVVAFVHDIFSNK